MTAQSAFRPKPETETETVEAGIRPGDTSELAQRLSEALADTYILYLQTQGAHWNVVGPTFYGVHNLTETQYEDLAGAIDEIAERIRAIGHISPSSFGEFAELSDLTSAPTDKSAGDLVEMLVESNEKVARRIRRSVHAAEAVDDVYTADLLTARIGVHEKAAWMLRSLLAG